MVPQSLGVAWRVQKRPMMRPASMKIRVFAAYSIARQKVSTASKDTKYGRASAASTTPAATVASTPDRPASPSETK